MQSSNLQSDYLHELRSPKTQCMTSFRIFNILGLALECMGACLCLCLCAWVCVCVCFCLCMFMVVCMCMFFRGGQVRNNFWFENRPQNHNLQPCPNDQYASMCRRYLAIRISLAIWISQIPLCHWDFTNHTMLNNHKTIQILGSSVTISFRILLKS